MEKGLPSTEEELYDGVGEGAGVMCSGRVHSIATCLLATVAMQVVVLVVGAGAGARVSVAELQRGREAGGRTHASQGSVKSHRCVCARSLLRHPRVWAVVIRGRLPPQAAPRPAARLGWRGAAFHCLAFRPSTAPSLPFIDRPPRLHCLLLTVHRDFTAFHLPSTAGREPARQAGGWRARRSRGGGPSGAGAAEHVPASELTVTKATVHRRNACVDCGHSELLMKEENIWCAVFVVAVVVVFVVVVRGVEAALAHARIMKARLF